MTPMRSSCSLTGSMENWLSEGLPVDAVAIRNAVKAIAVNPHGTFYFHTGRLPARRLL